MDKAIFSICLVVLTACQMSAPVQPAISLVPDAQGLAVLPNKMRIDFGRSPSGVIPVLDRELGPHQELALSNCPRDIVRRHQWSGLELTFTRERFVGWRQADQSQGLTCG